jgi:hypothetical protein
LNVFGSFKTGAIGYLLRFTETGDAARSDFFGWFCWMLNIYKNEGFKV